MCTSLRINLNKHYFGRTLDLDFHYNEEAVITPRNYEFKNTNSMTFKTKYALIGTAFVNKDYPLYYEAANEYGLAMAGLNFPYNAKYGEKIEGKFNISPFEFIPYILGNFRTIKEAKNVLENLNFVDINFEENMPLSPLHFMISDKEDCLVIEQTKDGLKLYENPYNVMTNNPPFDKQVLNINKFKNLTNAFKESLDPTYGCVGLDALGLPGDFSSESRFVKTHFLSKYALDYKNEEENVSQFFHILDSVSMVKNSVLTKNNKLDITFYTVCINTDEGIYYYKTYFNNQISALRLTNENKNGTKLIRHPLITIQNINYVN